MTCPCWVKVDFKRTWKKPCIFMPDAEAERVFWERGDISHFFKKFLQTSKFWQEIFVVIFVFCMFFEFLFAKHLPKWPFFLRRYALIRKRKRWHHRSAEENLANSRPGFQRGGAFKSLGKNEGWITGVGERERILEEIQIQLYTV